MADVRFCATYASPHVVPSDPSTPTEVEATATIGDVKGFAGEMADAVLRQILGWIDTSTPIVIHSGFDTLQRAVQDGSCHVGIQAMFKTPEREECCATFTDTFFEGGFAVLVRQEAPTGHWLGNLISRLVLDIIITGILAILFMSNAVWLVERKSGLFSDGYLNGLPQALWFSTMSLMSSDVGCTWQIPRTFIGRLISVLWMFFGIVLVAMFTAELSSAFTEQKLSRSKIENIEDMSGLSMCTEGPFYQSYFADTIRGMGLGIKEYPVERSKDFSNCIGLLREDFSNCIGLLRDQKVDGVLGNREELVDVFNRGEGRGLLVTPIFEKAFYSWITPPSANNVTLSSYRKSLNVALLKFRAGIAGTVPTYNQLVSKYYFGDPSVIAKSGSRINEYKSDWVLYGMTIGIVGMYVLLPAVTKLTLWWMRTRANKLADAQSLPSLKGGASSKSEKMMLSMVTHLEGSKSVNLKAAGSMKSTDGSGTFVRDSSASEVGETLVHPL
ncbi:hypothetical protein DUNSADRAFT_13616 [Dunaliella salina]|uniref:Ionotropic glutamate receptor C-terminal domain-containing protein n=1 Tax=Dunaliella salina TaxID=3046 RepID=A0ABQ7G910_DUNSA|nr:hypothetical protein DUNSADRAFT_13616 [Dunaliella salina]|eukprot:KAF5831097.1 hypothetical protein DUNSADRAFT_13616 [Dunaliella salina]